MIYPPPIPAKMLVPMKESALTLGEGGNPLFMGVQLLPHLSLKNTTLHSLKPSNTSKNIGITAKQ